VIADRGIEYEQNLSASELSVVMLVARSNRLEDLRPLIPEVAAVLKNLVPGELVKVGGQSS
jgi:hypothetical protein